MFSNSPNKNPIFESISFFKLASDAKRLFNVSCKSVVNCFFSFEYTSCIGSHTSSAIKGPLYVFRIDFAYPLIFNNLL